MSGKNENACCGVIEKLVEKYDHPFEKPISIEIKKDSQLKRWGWSLRLMKLTPAGNISQAHGMNAVIVMSFCPFCGKDLREPEEENV